MICDPRCDLSWRMFRVHLRRKCNLLFSDGMPYKYQLNLSGLLCHLKLVFPYYFKMEWRQGKLALCSLPKKEKPACERTPSRNPPVLLNSGLQGWRWDLALGKMVAKNVYSILDSKYYTECWSPPRLGNIFNSVTVYVWQGRCTKKRWRAWSRLMLMVVFYGGVIKLTSSHHKKQRKESVWCNLFSCFRLATSLHGIGI